MKVNVNRGKEKGNSSPFLQTQKNTFKNNKFNNSKVSQQIKSNNTSRPKSMPYRRTP